MTGTQLTLSNVQIDAWQLDRGSNGVASVLRPILARYLWQRPDSIDLIETLSGRVYLRDDVQGRPLYVSAASSDGVLAALVSREPRVGLDIQNPQFAELLTARIEEDIGSLERDLVAGLSPAARQRALLAIWTRKRALQQANAIVELVPLKSIAVGLGELALELPPSFGWIENWRLHSFTLPTGEIGSIAVHRHDQLLVLGAGDRRSQRARPSFPRHERRRQFTSG